MWLVLKRETFACFLARSEQRELLKNLEEPYAYRTMCCHEDNRLEIHFTLGIIEDGSFIGDVLNFKVI